MKERIKWVDTAKFLGIFAIYLGHMGDAAGNSRDFVFQYHVPLFFFLSGCMNTYDKEQNFLLYVIKQIQKILIPFWSFSLLSILIQTIAGNLDQSSVWAMLGIVARGAVRNTFFANSLWFLSCLFCMQVLFKLLKYLHNKGLLLLISLALYLIAEKVITPRPIVQPSWYYNLDSVFYYMLFFAIGYLSYSYILKLFYLDTTGKKIIFLATGTITALYSALIFLGNTSVLNFIANLPWVGIFAPVISALVMSWFQLVLARLLQDVTALNIIGQNTLFLCGNEWIIKTVLTTTIGLVGFNLTLSTPLHAYLYTTLLLVLCGRLLIPFEKKVIASIQSIHI